MLEKLKEYIEEKKLADRHDKILVAVSGGLDSMVLLQMLHTLKFSVAVAHCNFQLRGNDSDQDEKFVKQYCERLDIPFFSKRFDTNNYATEHKLSIQMAARNLRYSWFAQLQNERGFTRLATAHHFNDSIETVLLHWIRGGGIESMKGIAPVRGTLIRPLLFATRDELNQYAADHEINWREDSSNQTDDYQRNFIRHQVIPQLKRINVSLENTLIESIRKIEGELAFFNSSFDAWRDRNSLFDKGFFKLRKSALIETSYGASLLWRCIKEMGFDFPICEDIIRSIAGQSGRQFYSDSHRLVIDRDFLIVTRKQDAMEELIIDSTPSEASMGSLKMKVESCDEIKPSDLPTMAVLDADKIQFPLRWRKWNQGDYFYPLGMNQRKKVSDFLVDNKISMAEKESVTVLESAGEIVWLAGYRIDNRVKLTPETKRAISFTLNLI